MRKSIKAIGITLIVIAYLCIVVMMSPTLGRQVPFNRWMWHHHPVHKVRYYMSESLVEKLNCECPSQEETVALLGKPGVGSTSSDSHISYFLKGGGLMSIAMHTLEIYFDDEGAFVSAEVDYSD